VLGDWTLAATFNFTNTSQDIYLDCDLLGFTAEEDMIGFNCWDYQVGRFRGGRWALGSLPAHGAALWSFRRLAEGAQWVGDTVHISQGLCVRSWEVQGRHVHAAIHSNRSGEETVWLRIPGEVSAAYLDGEDLSVAGVNKDIVTFEIQLSELNVLDVYWD
jgi:hypothetical protein